MQLFADRGTDRLSVRVLEHPDAGTVALLLPAMGAPGGYYRRFAEVLREAGITVAIADLRGTGESSPAASRASRYGYDELIDDIGAVLDSLKPLREGKRTILIGHSLGGQLGLCHLGRSSGGIDGLVLIAAGVPYWRTYGAQGAIVGAYVQAIGAVSTVAGVWPGWTFGGRQAAGIMRDWAYTGRRGVFPARLRVEESVREVTVPVLAISVDNDRYTPPASLDHLLAKLESAKVRREHLTREAAGVPLDHFTWVKAGAPIRDLITDWLAG